MNRSFSIEYNVIEYATLGGTLNLDPIFCLLYLGKLYQYLTHYQSKKTTRGDLLAKERTQYKKATESLHISHAIWVNFQNYFAEQHASNISIRQEECVALWSLFVSIALAEGFATIPSSRDNQVITIESVQLDFRYFSLLFLLQTRKQVGQNRKQQLSTVTARIANEVHTNAMTSPVGTYAQTNMTLGNMLSPRDTARSNGSFNRYNAIARPENSPRTWDSSQQPAVGISYDPETEIRQFLQEIFPIFLLAAHYKYIESQRYTLRADCIDSISIFFKPKNKETLTNMLLKKSKQISLSSISTNAIIKYFTTQLENWNSSANLAEAKIEDKMSATSATVYYNQQKPNTIIMQGCRRESIFRCENPDVVLRSGSNRVNSSQPSQTSTPQCSQPSSSENQPPLCSKNKPVSLYIEDVQECNIYILHRISYLRIQSCRNCRIIVPTAEACISMVACSSLELYCVCRNLKVENCYDAKLHIYCATPIILLGDTRGTEIGPYGAIFSKQKQFMVKAGIKCTDSLIACWSKPIVLGVAQTHCNVNNLSINDDGLVKASGSLHRSASLWKSSNHRDMDKLYVDDVWQSSVYMLENPSNFRVFIIPELSNPYQTQPEAQTFQQSFFLSLPEVYAEQFKKTKSTILENQRTIMRLVSSLQRYEKQKLIQQICYQHFIGWLNQAGYGRELNDLVRIDLAQLKKHRLEKTSVVRS